MEETTVKKILYFCALFLLTPFFAACEVSNTDLANSLEGNMTRLVYSIGYLDSVSTEELAGLVNNSAYFQHSSLYSGDGIQSPVTNEASPTPSGLSENDAVNSNLSGIDNLRNSNFRHKGIISNETTSNNQLVNNVADTNVENADNNQTLNSNRLIVDLSLLETNEKDLNDILLAISQKRGIIMLYCTDLRSGRASLTAEDKEAVEEYVDIIKETANYLNNNAGALTGYMNNITSVAGLENSQEIINAKLIRANEVLKTRYAKLDTCLDSLDAILNIMQTRIGYDYSNMYNSTPITQNENISGSTIQNSTLDTETQENINPITNDNLDTTDNANNCNNNDDCNNCDDCPSNNISTYPIYPNQQNNLDNQPMTLEEGQDEIDEDIDTDNNMDNDVDNENKNTIINYNYEGNNSSSIVNEARATSLDPEANKNEIVLNGGLEKNKNSEKIPQKNIDSFLSEIVTTSLTPDSIFTETVDEDSSIKTTNFAPIKYEEEDCIMLLPKKSK